MSWRLDDVVSHEWYDLRDLGNAVGALQEQIEDWGAPDWVPYVDRRS